MSLGFDPTTVFGGEGFGNGRQRKKRTTPFKRGNGKRKKKMDDMEAVMEESMNGVNGARIFGKVNGIDLGIETFSISEPEGSVLELGSDFGERIGKQAGLANGTQNFLRQIGRTQIAVPQLVGREPTVAGAKRARKGRPRKVEPTAAGGFAGVARLFGGIEAVAEKKLEKKRKRLKKEAEDVEKEEKAAEQERKREEKELRRAREREEELELRREELETERQKVRRGGQTGATFI